MSKLQLKKYAGFRAAKKKWYQCKRELNIKKIRGLKKNHVEAVKIPHPLKTNPFYMCKVNLSTTWKTVPFRRKTLQAEPTESEMRFWGSLPVITKLNYFESGERKAPPQNTLPVQRKSFVTVRNQETGRGTWSNTHTPCLSIGYISISTIQTVFYWTHEMQWNLKRRNLRAFIK